MHVNKNDKAFDNRHVKVARIFSDKDGIMDEWKRLSSHPVSGATNSRLRSRWIDRFMDEDER